MKILVVMFVFVSLLVVAPVATAQDAPPATVEVTCVDGLVSVGWAYDGPLAYFNVMFGSTVVAYKVEAPASGMWVTGQESIEGVLRFQPVNLEQELPGYEVAVQHSCAPIPTAVSLQSFGAASAAVHLACFVAQNENEPYRAACVLDDGDAETPDWRVYVGHNYLPGIDQAWG
jgi:hypothetical protein